MSTILAVVALLAEAAEPVTALAFLGSGLFLLRFEATAGDLGPAARRLARRVGWAYLVLAGVIGVLLITGIVPWGLAEHG
ncbi:MULTISPECIES: hypothetical protein [Thermaerobacter]|uniref:Uncharacterized protein n=1 Tax=Thermaerobacter subterraneus DSM 13965 TaxID=867903 RepID=K6Q357_9FIRM|nr:MULTISPECIES: hypothetical protein [Thermaerobacter]EKP95698.1 hypothetical protein ThesuDRAFT_01457 [Thermaerobacter subterraneus DSM 13965]QIA27323.1 hypothetical protein DYI95_007065 [Thermaerobacter sp. PB12/4term]